MSRPRDTWDAQTGCGCVVVLGLLCVLAAWMWHEVGGDVRFLAWCAVAIGLLYAFMLLE